MPTRRGDDDRLHDDHEPAGRPAPGGTTLTYGDIADKIGAPRAAVRAVGTAIGANPLLVVRPCHRVIGAGGALTGYAGGLERKQQLLDLENVHQAA